MYHHKENKGDDYANKKLSEMVGMQKPTEASANYFPKDIPILIQLTDDDSSSEEDDEEFDYAVEDNEHSNNICKFNSVGSALPTSNCTYDLYSCQLMTSCSEIAQREKSYSPVNVSKTYRRTLFHQLFAVN